MPIGGHRGMEMVVEGITPWKMSWPSKNSVAPLHRLNPAQSRAWPKPAVVEIMASGSGGRLA